MKPNFYRLLSKLFPNATFSLHEDGQGNFSISDWQDPDGNPEPDLDTLLQDALDEEQLAQVDQKKQEIRTLAEKKIQKIIPMHKQLNLLANSIFLLDKGKPNWSQAETDQVNDMKASWSKINDIRDHSNQLEVDVESDINTDIETGWPHD